MTFSQKNRQPPPSVRSDMTISLNGLGRLHVVHLAIAIICSLSLMQLSSKLRDFNNADFPDKHLDYWLAHHVALPAIIMNGVIVLISLSVVTINALRKQAFRLLYEIGWIALCIILQTCALVLISLAFPAILSQISYTQRTPHPEQWLSFLDWATVLKLDWIITLLLSAMALVILILHLTWHLVVAIRHRAIRPRVWFEHISGSYAWTLPAEIEPQFEYPVPAMSNYYGFPTFGIRRSTQSSAQSIQRQA